MRKVKAIEARERPGFESEGRGWLSSGLSVSDEPQDDPKASRREEPSVLFICNLPDLTHREVLAQS